MLGKFQDSYKTDTEFPQDGLSVGYQATSLTADGHFKRYQTEASVEGKQDIFIMFRNNVDHRKAEFNSCRIPAPSIKAEEDIKQTGLNTRIIKTSEQETYPTTTKILFRERTSTAELSCQDGYNNCLLYRLSWLMPRSFLMLRMATSKDKTNLNLKRIKIKWSPRFACDWYQLKMY